MREIKYRAWDGEKMHYIDLYKYMSYNEESQEIYMPCKARDEGLMQYAGLKDKNGSGIYEDDIVKFKDSIYKVVIPNVGLGGQLQNNKGCEILARLHLSGYISQDGKYFPDCEVIGNIHQNPELLPNQ